MQLARFLAVFLLILPLSFAADFELTIDDYIAYDEYIDRDSSSGITVSLGSYTYEGTNWVGFRCAMIRTGDPMSGK
ncbi:MAG: hypothetical protein MUC31_03200 [Bacteroidales bacterium]|nr:hypothetical protein [Bacteroidales bacterium]